MVEIERIRSEDVSATEVLEANILLKSLTETHEKLRNFDETIADLIEREEDLNKDDLDALMFDTEVKKSRREVKRIIYRQHQILVARKSE